MTGSFYSKGIRHMVPQFQKERFYAGCQPQHPYKCLFILYRMMFSPSISVNQMIFIFILLTFH